MKLEKMQGATEDWVLEDPTKRHVISIVGDKGKGLSSSAIHGVVEDIVGTMVNEMLADEDVAFLIKFAMEVYNNIKEEEESEEEHPKSVRHKGSTIVS